METGYMYLNDDSPWFKKNPSRSFRLRAFDEDELRRAKRAGLDSIGVIVNPIDEGANRLFFLPPLPPAYGFLAHDSIMYEGYDERRNRIADRLIQLIFEGEIKLVIELLQADALSSEEYLDVLAGGEIQ